VQKEETVMVEESKDAALQPERKKRGGGNWARHQYIEAHKDEIIDTFLEKGWFGIRDDWGITPGGWFSVSRRWAEDIEKRRLEAGEKGSPEFTTSVSGDTINTTAPTDWERKYLELKAEYEGYRKAVKDMFEH